MTTVISDGLAERRAVYGNLPPHLVAAGALLADLAKPGGTLSLAETIGRRSQRLYLLVDRNRLGTELAEKLRGAEEAIYEALDDPTVNWDEQVLAAALQQAGFQDVSVEGAETEAETRVQPATLDRWFAPSAQGERPSYRERLMQKLIPEELAAVETLYRGQLTGQTVAWHSVTAFVVARRQQHDPQNGRY